MASRPKTRPSKLPRKKLARPLVASMLAAQDERPTFTITRLKDGERTWTIKATGPTIALAIKRAQAEVRGVMMHCLAEEVREREQRAHQKEVAALLVESAKAAKEAPKEEGGK